MTTSSGSVPPPSTLSYTGAVFVPFIIRNFGPQPENNTFAVPTLWIDPLNGSAYILIAKPMGVADWLPLGTAAGNLNQIDTPTGGPVMPVAGEVTFANGTGMNIVGAGDTVTFNVTGSGITWVDVSGTSASMSINSGYISDNGALVTLTLPSTAAQGSVIEVAGKGAGGWSIAQNSGQTIHFGSVNTTTGVGGSLSSTNSHDSIRLLCITADTDFQVLSSIGNITFV